MIHRHRRHRRRSWLLLVSLLLVGLVLPATAGSAAVPHRPQPSASGAPGLAAATGAGRAAVQVQGDQSAGSWLVTFKDDASDAAVRGARRSVAALGGSVGRQWQDAVVGFEVEGPAGLARALARRPGIATVESNDEVTQSVVEQPATWGLDRTDQRDLPLNGRYASDTDGDGVRVYVIDSGVYAGHAEFSGRVLVDEGGTSIEDGRGSDDCNGHGTHVAGTVAGETYGIAQDALIVPMRVMDCSGVGTQAGLVSALDFLASNAVLPAVANLSLGGPPSSTVDAAVRAVIDAGVTVVAAAGNESGDACSVSPARVTGAITVAASTPADNRAVFSNHGSCVDLFAPGVDIVSAWPTGRTATRTLAGTSMSSPHVAGVAALALSATPDATPAEVASLITSTATPNRLTGELGSPDLLLYSSLASSDPPTPETPEGCGDYADVFSADLTEGGTAYLPPTADYTTTQRLLHEGCLDGPDGADFDLGLVRYNPGTGQYDLVASSLTTAPDEQISVNANAGDYAWVVHAYAGSGTFQMGYSLSASTDGPGGDGQCDLDTDTDGTLGDGDQVVASQTFVLDRDDVTRACLSGPSPSEADFDLLLQRRNADGTWATVDATWSNGSDEQVDHTAYYEGTYRWAVASFVGSGSWSVSWRATPTTTLQPIDTSRDGAVTARFSSTTDGASFRCSLDGTATRACTSPARFTGLSDGKHTLRVWAVDGFGNLDPSPARRDFRVDLATGAGQFIDVGSDNIFRGDIGKLADAGITRGCNPPANSRFCPDDAVTRGQMAAFLVRALDLRGSSADLFDDDDASIFEGDIQALAAAGITRGCNPPANSRFCPDDAVTRGQMAAFLVRALDLRGSTSDLFDDDDASIFEGDIQALAAAGITRGCNPPANSRFCPDDVVTRQQMAAFLVRAGLT